MFKISYSPDLRGEVLISGSKNAALPIIAANYLIDQQIQLENKPDISDVRSIEKLAEDALSKSTNFFDLTSELATKFRASILLIPVGLKKFGEVRFVGSGGCKIGKRPLDTFEDALHKAGVEITHGQFKTFKVVGKPKKNIMLQEFSVTATEALITYLAFLDNVDYEITVYQVATEPHVKNLIDFLNAAGADIHMGIDHTITVNPKKIAIKEPSFKIISDYIEAGTYFAIGAGADNSELIIRNVNVDDLSAMYNIASKIGINFKILDKQTLVVNSYNKANYKAVKLEIRIFPGFPSDLQSIFGALASQFDGVTKIFETLYEGRFGYLNELENLGGKIEILNPHQALVIGKTELHGGYVSSTDLRGGGAMVLAGIMAKGETMIMNEDIIARGYADILNKLSTIGVKISALH
ncbi:UDP-N-acetylglucosamine 1-carboxyvinyltransferase [Candidatus Gracilibacteria bacterium]|nr:MAG: UDP-N-acetylglucosamine 1-carboxyvinyltransferase [Candidatus Gracilibacteria bacterium]